MDFTIEEYLEYQNSLLIEEYLEYQNSLLEQAEEDGFTIESKKQDDSTTG